ncbi:MAG: S8 family serine peptidase, partial [Bacteroidales bacterium]|nr:S8 family serine peptidase [Bacteroidales bacterium]
MKTTIASIFFSICCLQTLFSQNLKHLYDLDGNLLFYHMHDTTYYAEFMETTDSATICNINLQCAAFADIDTIADRMFRYNIPYNSISVFNQLMVGNEHLKFCRNEFSPIQSTDIIWPTNKILVKIKSTENIDSIISQSGINIVLTTQMSYDTMVYAISIFDTNDVFEYANRIFETNKVVYSQPSCYNVIHKCSYEDNPRFEDQWYLQQYPDTIFPSDIPEIIIDMVPAWNLTCGSPDVKIAIIDDGIDSYHEDLADNIYSMNDFTDNPQSPFGQCGSFDSHGTQCAGVACAVDNTVGIIGVASKSKVAVLRSMYNTYINNRKMTICNDEWLIQALYNAVNTINAQIVSCSWRRSYSSVLTEAINNLAQAGRCGKGTIFVFSAGNYEFPNDSFSVGFPASLQNTISVGSICENGLRVGANGTFPTFPYWESCYGNGLDLSAPGVSIMTTNPNNSYNGEFQGTSASAPQVSGVAALMLSLDSTLTRQEVYEILCSTASKVALDSNRYMANPLHPYGVWSNQVGYGLVNAHHALLKTLYKDYYISGPDTINLCEQTSYTLYGTRPFNDSITNCWTSSSNIDIISMEDSIVVRGNLFGDGWIAFNIIHDGDSLPIIYPIYVNAVVPIVKDSIFNTNTTINDEILFVGDLIVSATLTITDTVLMAPSARLIVRPGGKLIVNGGTLTNACEGEMWEGIIVEGNANLPQYAQLQGSVILNNATVENARNAISTRGADTNAVYEHTGGIVQATNTLFRNNRRAAEFIEYENHSGSNVTDNTSRFT